MSSYRRHILIALGGLVYFSAYAEESGLSCRVRCSDTQLRTGIAELIWSAPAGAAATRAQAVLDVSVFHGGFKRGLYQSFGTVAAGGTPQAEPSPSRDVKDESRTQRAYDLKLRLPEQARGMEKDAVVVQTIEIENLEPGLLYRFRLRDAGIGDQEVTCEAPVCPADMKEGG